MADTKYSGLAVTTAASSNIWGAAQSGTSWAVYQSSVALVPFDHLNLGARTPENFSSDAQSTIAMYAADRGGRLMPAWADIFGVRTDIQAHLFDSDVFQWYPNSATAAQSGMQGLNGGTISLGTASTGLPVVGTRYNVGTKGVFRGSTGAAAMTAGVCLANATYFQGSTAGLGGYFFAARFALDTFASSTCYFVGLTESGTSQIASTNVTSMINAVGFGFNNMSTATDANGTSFVFFHSSTSTNGTRTETLLGQPALATGNCYDAYIYAPPNTTRIYYRLDDYNNRSTLVNSSVQLHTPNSTTFMRAVAMCGQLNTSSGAARIGVVKLYAERLA